MKKILLMLVMILIIPILASCEKKPYEDCIDTWDYKLETRVILFVDYTAYVLETKHGDVTVTKSIYTSAQAGEYSEICVIVTPNQDSRFVGGTLKDGTAIDKSVVDEIADQIIPEDLQDEIED